MKLRKKVLLYISVIIILFVIYIIIYNVLNSNKMSKKRIIRSFSENIDVFNDVVEYINNTDGLFSFYYDHEKKCYISKNIVGDTEYEIIVNDDFKEKLIYIIDELGFKYIYEWDDYIFFMKDYSIPEHGILYLKNHNINEHTPYISHIDDNWYYYSHRFV